MNVYCFDCGMKGRKMDMIVSRHTGRLYCRDQRACFERLTQQAIERALQTATAKVQREKNAGLQAQ